VEIGTRVIRTKGDYVVGRTGTIVAFDNDKSRVQVKWDGETTTWVSLKVIELLQVPYELIKDVVTRRLKYVRLETKGDIKT
jgi:hypothetical protein